MQSLQEATPSMAYTCHNESDGIDGSTRMLSAAGVQAVLNGPNSDDGAITVDELTANLGLDGNVPALSKARRDKLAMQQALQTAQIRHIRSFAASSAREAIEKLRRDALPFPVVVKPANGAGSVHVEKCESEDELRASFSRIIGESLPWSGELVNELVVQEFVQGAEFVVNCVSHAGCHRVTDMWGAAQKLAPRMVYIREDLVLSSAEHTDFVGYTCRALDALGLRTGPSHSELVKTDEGAIVLIELNPRMTGGQVTSAQDVGCAALDIYAESLSNPEAFRCRPFYYQASEHVTSVFLIAPAGTEFICPQALSDLTELKSFHSFDRGQLHSYARASFISFANFFSAKVKAGEGPPPHLRLNAAAFIRAFPPCIAI